MKSIIVGILVFVSTLGVFALGRVTAPAYAPFESASNSRPAVLANKDNKPASTSIATATKIKSQSTKTQALSPAAAPKTVTQSPKPAETTPAVAGYTKAQVAAHNNSDACWTIIAGNVYDLTSYIYQHPGGAREILSMCGKDGTVGFTAQHGGERRPANELAGLYLGQLTQ